MYRAKNIYTKNIFFSIFCFDFIFDISPVVQMLIASGLLYLVLFSRFVVLFFPLAFFFFPLRSSYVSVFLQARYFFSLKWIFLFAFGFPSSGHSWSVNPLNPFQLTDWTRSLSLYWHLPYQLFDPGCINFFRDKFK